MIDIQPANVWSTAAVERAIIFAMRGAYPDIEPDKIDRTVPGNLFDYVRGVVFIELLATGWPAGNA